MKPIFDKIPGGVSGQFVLNPKISKEENLHVHQVVRHLESRQKEFGVKLRIDVQLIPIGVLISWGEDKEQ